MRRLGVVLVLATMGAGATFAHGESVEDKARRERERRQKMEESGGPAPVIDSESVKTAPAEPRPAARAVPPTGKDVKPTEKAASESDESDRRKEDERLWRGRVAQAQERIDNAQKVVEVADSLPFIGGGETLVDEQGRTIANTQGEILQQRAAARAALEQAREAMERLLEDARRANVPPGWLP